MSDKKITQLDELETLENGDLFVVVDSVDGVPVTKKITFETLVDFVASSEDISLAISSASPEISFDDENNVVCNAVFS